MSDDLRVGEALQVGGVPIPRVLGSLRRLEPSAHAFYLYDLDALGARARRFTRAFEALAPLTAYALKANALGALLSSLAAEGLGADAASLGEMTQARAAGFDASRLLLNGNGKTVEEIAWAARERVHSVNADHVAELDVLEREAGAAGTRVRVALRVNPGIATAGHPYVATGDAEAKFGVSPAEALAAWSARDQWPHLVVDGLHVHVGSQVLDPTALSLAATFALELAREAAARGAPLRLLNLGGGFGVDYADPKREFPLEAFAAELHSRIEAGGMPLDLVLEPGRWLVAAIGTLVAEVLWVKQRDERRFVVLAAGMNDFLRPALYGARHRIVPVAPRSGAVTPATLVGPVCESADVFDQEALLPPLARGDLVAIQDAGAYGASMASNYNGRGRLAELVVSKGKLIRARAGEGPADLSRATSDLLEG